MREIKRDRKFQEPWGSTMRPMAGDKLRTDYARKKDEGSITFKEGINGRRQVSVVYCCAGIRIKDK